MFFFLFFFTPVGRGEGEEGWKGIDLYKDLMQGKLFQRCTHLLYCSLLSLGGNVRRMSKPDMGSIFHIKNQWNILVIESIMWIIKIIKI